MKLSTITHADSVGRRAWVECSTIRAFVCLFVQSITKKMNDPKVFKFGIGNDLVISYK